MVRLAAFLRWFRQPRWRSGVSAVEFALMAPVLVLLLGTSVYFGMMNYQQMEVQNAVQMGALYAASAGYDSAGVADAVANASSLGAITLTPPPSQFCGCATGGSIVAQSCTPACTSCTSLCPSGQAPGTYARVAGQGTYTPLFGLPGLPGAVTLSAQATVRIR